jgi:hypothetical protein
MPKKPFWKRRWRKGHGTHPLTEDLVRPEASEADARTMNSKSEEGVGRRNHPTGEEQVRQAKRENMSSNAQIKGTQNVKEWETELDDEERERRWMRDAKRMIRANKKIAYDMLRMRRSAQKRESRPSPGGQSMAIASPIQEREAGRISDDDIQASRLQEGPHRKIPVEKFDIEPIKERKGGMGVFTEASLSVGRGERLHDSNRRKKSSDPKRTRLKQKAPFHEAVSPRGPRLIPSPTLRCCHDDSQETFMKLHSILFIHWSNLCATPPLSTMWLEAGRLSHVNCLNCSRVRKKLHSGTAPPPTPTWLGPQCLSCSS